MDAIAALWTATEAWIGAGPIVLFKSNPLQQYAFCYGIGQAFLVQERRIRLIGFKGQGSIVISKKKEREIKPKILSRICFKKKRKKR